MRTKARQNRREGGAGSKHSLLFVPLAMENPSAFEARVETKTSVTE